MPRNVEIKARVRDMNAVRVRAAALSDAPAVVLEQEDTFFNVPDGRLKLRVFPDGKGELIAYRRPDSVGPKTSEYFVYRTPHPERFERASHACARRPRRRAQTALALPRRRHAHSPR